MITLVIIIITASISIPAFNNRELFYRFDFSPYQVAERKEWYRFFSHALLHGDWMHLIINMVVLYLFGRNVEIFFQIFKGGGAAFYYLLLYVGGLAFAVLPTYRKHQRNPNYHSVGASGAVSAVMMSSVIFSPQVDLCLYGLPFLCFPGIFWAIAYLVYSYVMGKKGVDHINHDAHLWGAIYGIVFTLIAIPKSGTLFIQGILGLLPF